MNVCYCTGLYFFRLTCRHTNSRVAAPQKNIEQTSLRNNLFYYPIPSQDESSAGGKLKFFHLPSITISVCVCVVVFVCMCVCVCVQGGLGTLGCLLY